LQTDLKIPFSTFKEIENSDHCMHCKLLGFTHLDGLADSPQEALTGQGLVVDGVG